MPDDLLTLAAPDASAVEKLELRPIELLKEGWALVKPHYFELLAIFVLMAIVNGVVSRLPLGFVLSLALSAVVQPGALYFLLERYRGNRVGLEAVLVPIQRKPAELITVFLLTTVIVLVGFALVILPGLYAAAVLMFATPLVLFSPTPVVESLKLSHRLVSARLGDFVVLVLGLGLANVIAAIPCGLGLLISLPATLGAVTLVIARAFRIAPAVSVAPVASV